MRLEACRLAYASIGKRSTPPTFTGRAAGGGPSSVCSDRGRAIGPYFFAAAAGAVKYLSANAIDVGQFGAGGWPALCWRKATSPSIRPVSIFSAWNHSGGIRAKDRQGSSSEGILLGALRYDPAPIGLGRQSPSSGRSDPPGLWRRHPRKARTRSAEAPLDASNSFAAGDRVYGDSTTKCTSFRSPSGRTLCHPDWRLDLPLSLRNHGSVGRAAPQMGDRASADSLRWNLDLILDQRGAEMADVHGGASGMLVRDYKGKEADPLVTRIDPGVVSLVAELRGHDRQAAEELAVEGAPRGAQTPRCIAAGGGHARPAADRRGRHRQRPLGMIVRARLNSSREERRLMTDSRGAQRVAPLRLGLCGQIGAIPPPMRNRAASLSVTCRVVIRCREFQG
jgi:hypothetical protein